MARAQAYPQAKFYFDPSNRLATIDQRYRQTGRQTDRQTAQRSDSIGRTVFWAAVCKTVRPMLSDRCLSVLFVLSVCPVCNVGVLWSNGLTDQDETWHAGRPRPGHIVLDGDPASPPPKRGRSPPIFGPCLLWPNGWMDQDGTWKGGRPQSRRHCGVRWGPSPLPKKGAEPTLQFLEHFYCGQTAGCTKMPLGMELGFS